MVNLTETEIDTLAKLSADSFRIGLFGCDGTGAQLDACRSLARYDMAEYHHGAYRITKAGREALAAVARRA